MLIKTTRAERREACIVRCTTQHNQDNGTISILAFKYIHKSTIEELQPVDNQSWEFVQKQSKADFHSGSLFVVLHLVNSKHKRILALLQPLRERPEFASSILL